MPCLGPHGDWVSFCCVPASDVRGPAAGPGGELPAGVPHYTLFPATLGSWPTGRQPSEEMASFLFLNVRKARLTSTGERRSGARQKKWEEVAQSWPELQAVTYQWGRRWKPHQQQPELRQVGLQGLGSPGPEGGPEVACAASDLPAGGPHTHAGLCGEPPPLPSLYVGLRVSAGLGELRRGLPAKGSGRGGGFPGTVRRNICVQKSLL